MIRRFATLLLFCCVVAFVAHAQTADPGSKIPATVLAAEQEGALFPRSQLTVTSGDDWGCFIVTVRT